MFAGTSLSVGFLVYHKWESVSAVIDGLRSVDVANLIQLRKIAF